MLRSAAIADMEQLTFEAKKALAERSAAMARMSGGALLVVLAVADSILASVATKTSSRRGLMKSVIFARMGSGVGRFPASTAVSEKNHVSL